MARSKMSNPDTTTSADPTTAESLGIQAGHRVRLIGSTPNLEAVLAPLPKDVVVTNLGSESAAVGLIVVDDEADLRERLFTELNGLIGATHVWILTSDDTGPSTAEITEEAELVTWHYLTELTLDEQWTAVRIQKS
jgi:hypothetical protein